MVSKKDPDQQQEETLNTSRSYSTGTNRNIKHVTKLFDGNQSKH